MGTFTKKLNVQNLSELWGELGSKSGKSFENLVTLLAIGAIHFYQVHLSVFFTGQCRFEPSCSDYALESVQTHGVFKGVALSVRRLCRCHPFSRGSFDPVPGPSNPEVTT